jgi:hypothetical protein
VAIVYLLAADTLTLVEAFVAATAITFATLDETRDLLHFDIASPLNAIGMHTSRVVGAGAGAAENNWDVLRGSGGVSKEVADAAGEEHCWLVGYIMYLVGGCCWCLSSGDLKYYEHS